MKNIELLFECNKSKITSLKKLGKQNKLVINGVKKYWQYTNFNHVFSGKSIKSLINFLDYINTRAYLKT